MKVNHFIEYDDEENDKKSLANSYILYKYVTQNTMWW